MATSSSGLMFDVFLIVFSRSHTLVICVSHQFRLYRDMAEPGRKSVIEEEEDKLTPRYLM